MRVLLTGGNGFVGRALQTTMANWGGYISSRSCTMATRGWQVLLRSDILAGNVSMQPVDVLIHLEVHHHSPRATPENCRLFSSVNIEGTRRWLDWCTRHGVCRFVFFSSIKAVKSEAIGATTEIAHGPGPTAYGASKWAAEELVREWTQASAQRSALIVRPAVVYGKEAKGNVGAMISAIRRDKFYLVGRNSNIKSLVSIGNLRAALVHLVARMETGKCDAFNVVDPESYSVRTLDRMMREHLGKRGNSPTLPFAVARCAAVVGDCLETLGVPSVPVTSQRLEAMLEHTHFSSAKLMDTGFVHPANTDQEIEAMLQVGGLNG
jgi:UDP-glucose 4-epimerase